MSTQGMFNEIPVIDASPLLDDSAAGRKLVAEHIDYAYSQVGFALITNHGIDQASIDAVFAANAEFHALPDAQKLKVVINDFQRGFIPMKSVHGLASAEISKPNQCESFLVLHELAKDDPDVLAGVPLAGPNQWPEELPDFRVAIRAYEDAMRVLSQRLVRAIAVALGAEDYALDRFFEHPTTFLRLLHYPPQPAEIPADVFGSAPHTDYGFMTILAQDDAGGLQVGNTAGEWIDVPCVPGTFVMNCADILHRWSNGRFISTPHRVVNRSGRDRYSQAFFFDPDLHTEIIPLQSCIQPHTQAQFQPVIYGDYLLKLLNATIDSGAYPVWEKQRTIAPV